MAKIVKSGGDPIEELCARQHRTITPATDELSASPIRLSNEVVREPLCGLLEEKIALLQKFSLLMFSTTTIEAPFSQTSALLLAEFLFRRLCRNVGASLLSCPLVVTSNRNCLWHWSENLTAMATK
jgi:hypothetical protein